MEKILNINTHVNKKIKVQCTWAHAFFRITAKHSESATIVLYDHSLWSLWMVSMSLLNMKSFYSFLVVGMNCSSLVAPKKLRQMCYESMDFPCNWDFYTGKHHICVLKQAFILAFEYRNQFFIVFVQLRTKAACHENLVEK